MGLYQLKYGFRRFLKPLLTIFGKTNPDILAYIAVIVSGGTGWFIYASGSNDLYLIAVALLVFVRMILNTLDGLIALDQGKKTLVGDIVNALPDRYCDVFVLVGIALYPGVNKLLGLAMVCSVLLVRLASVRMVRIPSRSV